MSVEEIFVKNSFEKFAFCKGETLHFFFPKKKKVSKKKLATLQVDGLSGFIPQSPLALRESLREHRAFRLTKGISPLVGSLKNFDRMAAFLWVNKQDYHSPKIRFYPLGVRREVG